MTATITSYQVTVAEDELRHPCSTAGDEDFHNWFRSQARYHKSGRRDLKTWTRTIDELQTNENSSATRSAILLGFKTLLAEDSFEDVQAIVLVFFLVTVGGLE